VEIYHQKSRWKVYLAIGGIVILLISMLFTNYIAGQLAQEERQKVNLFVSAQKNMAAENRSQDDDTTMEFDVMLKNSGVQPIIGSDGYGKYAYYKQTRMLTLLEYFPWIQAILFLAFIGIGYMAQAHET